MRNNYSHTDQKVSSTLVLACVSIIFIAFVAIGLFIMSWATSLVLAAHALVLFFPLFRKSKNKERYVIHPAIVLFCILPLSFLAALYYEQTSAENLSLLLIMTYSYSISSLMLIIVVPLAIISRKKSAEVRQTFTPPISIIIPAYNEEKVVARTIDSVLSAAYPKKEVIVVNNGSTDNTGEILQEYKDRIKIVDEPKKGKANAINRGISLSSGEVLIIMDADTIVSKDAFANIVKPFANNPKLGAVTGNVKILNPTNVHTKIQVLEYALASQIGKAALASQDAVNIVSGAFGAFRRSVIVSGESPFSTDTLTEDLDATISILKRGYTTTIQNDAIAYTEAPSNFKDLIKQRTRWYRGLIQGYVKHPELLKKPQFGQFPSLMYFMMFNSSLIVPMITMINLGAVIPTILYGNVWLTVVVFLLNMIAGCALFALSLQLNGERLSYMKLFPLAFFYLQVHHFVYIKTIFDHILGRNAEWNHLKRIGGSVKIDLVEKVTFGPGAAKS